MPYDMCNYILIMKGNDYVFEKGQRFAQNIRKEHRQAIFAKRRNIDSRNEQIEQTFAEIQIVDGRFEKHILQWRNMKFKENDLMVLRNKTISDDIVLKHEGIFGIRQLLSSKKNPPIQMIIDAGLIDYLMQYVNQNQFPQLQLESAWCLTNISAGSQSQCNHIIDSGGVKVFSNLLLQNNIGLIEQSIWILGNMVCDGYYERDKVIRSGGLQNMLSIGYKLASNEKILKALVWSLSNICRIKPIPHFSQVEGCVVFFAQVLKKQLIKDPPILSNMLWAMSNYCRNEEKGEEKVDKIQRNLEYEYVHIVMNLVQNAFNENIVVACLRIIGNLSCGSDQQCGHLLRMGLINSIHKLLMNKSKVIRRDVCWIYSNIASGNAEQVNELVSQPNLINELMGLLKEDGDDVRAQIISIFGNMAQNGNRQMVFNILREVQIVKYYSHSIINNNSNLILLEYTIEALDTTLLLGQSFKQNNLNYFVWQLHEIDDVIHQMQQLQFHESKHISSKVLSILIKYFQLQNPFNI